MFSYLKNELKFKCTNNIKKTNCTKIISLQLNRTQIRIIINIGKTKKVMLTAKHLQNTYFRKFKSVF